MTDNTITYKNVNYEFDTLSDRAKYIIQQVDELRKEEIVLQNKIARIDMAVQGFSSVLGEELEAPTKEPEEETSSED